MEFDDEKGAFANLVHIITVVPEKKLCGKVDDFAVLVFDKPLFKYSGYFGAKTFDCKRDRDKPIYKHAGYPVVDNKIKRIRQDNISVKICKFCDQATQLATDTDVEKGQSGGPLYRVEDGVAWQYGILSGWGKLGSIYTSGPNFVNAIALARERYS
ncbi:trypsin serine protease [Fusarium longipes]|uniref:Trypsin serine protease n=1 Tax=Fusarium longipes TaxID=694270 RepID=A0A395TAE1_9HYPO|nr:trypsin serine protease [Fusarium longipes]